MSRSEKSPETRTKGKTKQRAQLIPHSELSEYASLLRSMRINDMGDLTGELIRCGKRENEEADNEEELKRSRKRRRLQHQRQTKTIHLPPIQIRRKPDTDTLWPPFPEHCQVPEFSFEEEIAAIAEEWMRNRVRSQSHGAGDGSGGNECEDENVDEGTLEVSPIREFDFILPTIPLVLSSTTFLRTLLHMLAFHTIRSAISPQSRGRPMTWVDVIEVAASGGGVSELQLRDSKVFERIQTRLCAIYGDHEHSVASHISIAISNSKQALRQVDQKFQNIPGDKITIPDAFRNKYKAAEGSAQENESDEEEEEDEDEDEEEDEEGNEDVEEEGNEDVGEEDVGEEEAAEERGEEEGEEEENNRDESVGEGYAQEDDDGSGNEDEDKEKSDNITFRTIPPVSPPGSVSTSSTPASQNDSSSDSDSNVGSSDEKDTKNRTYVKTKASKAEHPPSSSSITRSNSVSKSNSGSSSRSNSSVGSGSSSNADSHSNSNSNPTDNDSIQKPKLKIPSSTSQSKHTKYSERIKPKHSTSPSLPPSSQASQSLQSLPDEGTEDEGEKEEEGEEEEEMEVEEVEEEENERESGRSSSAG